MNRYRLEYQPLGSGSPLERSFEALSDEAALRLAAIMIAESHAAPDAYVQMDEAAGQVMVGAGYWSRRGSFTLCRI